MKKFIDLSGSRFGRLLVVCRGEDAICKSARVKRWKCVCDCGIERLVAGCSLRNGDTTSCGCYNKEVARSRVKHGAKSGGKPTRAYTVWASMVARCTNPNAPGYKRYGGRGISVCSQWRQFDRFLADMGNPAIGQSIDRIDNNGNYELGNCRWADKKQQARNRRSNRIFTHDGITSCLASHCERLGVPYDRVLQRINKLGWSIDKAIAADLFEAIA